jgi:hypothetical protein
MGGTIYTKPFVFSSFFHNHYMFQPFKAILRWYNVMFF